MANGHTIAPPGDAAPTGVGPGAHAVSPNGSQPDAWDRLAALLRGLNQFEFGPMGRVEVQRTLGLLGQAQSMITSLMCDLTRRVEDSDPEADLAEVLRRGARLAGRESKKLANVSSHLRNMPKVRERFASGEITTNHVNALVNAAEKVGTEAVEADDKLIRAARRILPDSFEQHARRWSNEKLIEQGIDLLERQRRDREAKMWVEAETGLGVLWAKFPRAQFEHVRQAVDNHYKAHLSRDIAEGEGTHQERTPKQRLADVVFELLTNRDADSGEPIEGTTDVKAKASTQLILVAPFGVVDGTEPDGQVEIIGTGPVPRNILETLSPDTELAGMVYDRTGRPLWLGRNQRLANAPQRLAVAVRDGGCFECGAPMHRCDLHHVQEWHRDRGRTDIDNLVAVCRRHHKWLEANNLVVRRTPTGYQTHPRDGPQRE